MSGFYRHIYEQKMEGGIGKEGEKTVKNYRKRKSSADDTKGESDKEETSEISKNTIKAHLPCNLDADSDFEIDSSDSEAEAKLKKPDEIKQEEHSLADIHLPDENGKVDEKPEVPPEVKVEELPEVPKIDIWKKRTVGEAFDEAVQRYYHRKAQRGAAAWNVLNKVFRFLFYNNFFCFATCVDIFA